MSSITPQQLAELFAEGMKAFGQGDVSRAAQVVGGKVISGMPAVTRNARDMTAMLAGTQSYRGTGTPPAGFSIPTASNPGGEAGGTRGRPLVVEFSNEAAANLAQHMTRQAREPGAAPSGLEKFLQGFGLGHAAGPLGTVGRLLRSRFAPPASEVPEHVAGLKPSWLSKPIDLINQRLSEEAWKNAGGEAGGAGKRGTMDPNVARRARRIQLAETFSGVPGGKGWSQLIRPEAAAGSGVAGTSGLAALAGIAGKVAGGVMAFAEVASAAIGTAKALHAFAEATVEGNAHLAKWNGQLAVAEAHRQIGEIRREAQMAGATGGTSSSLSTEYNKLADEFQPIAQELATLKNVASEAFVELLRVVTFIWKATDMVVGPILRFVEWTMGSEKPDLPLASLFAFIEQTGRLDAARNTGAVEGARAVRPGGAGAGGGMAPAAAMAPSARHAPLAGLGSGRGLARSAGGMARLEPAGQRATQADPETNM